jgi:hypothetical protein
MATMRWHTALATLVIVLATLGVTLTLSGCAEKPGPESQAVGAWRAADGWTWTFDADGTFSSTGPASLDTNGTPQSAAVRGKYVLGEDGKTFESVTGGGVRLFETRDGAMLMLWAPDLDSATRVLARLSVDTTATFDTANRARISILRRQ